MNFESSKVDTDGNEGETDLAETQGLLQSTESAFKNLIAIPAFITLISACTESPSVEDLENVLKTTEFIEQVPEDQFSELKTNLEELFDIVHLEDRRFTTIEMESGRQYRLTVPSGGRLFVEEEISSPDAGEVSSGKLRTYSLYGPGIVMTERSDDSAFDKTSSKVSIMDSSKGPVITYSVSNDTENAYRLGDGFNNAVSADDVTTTITFDNDLIETWKKQLESTEN